jgi:nucleoside-diphosphate-sugar epimerase/predicted dehydrogenase
VDRDVDRARQLAREYGVPTVLGDVRELDPKGVDAAVVATPPSHHAPCCIDLAQRGLHVFVEKPMAITTEAAAAMVDAAEKAGVALAVGLFRRLLPRTRLLRALLESGATGRPLGFDVEQGGVGRGGSATLALMRKDLAGGGVLIDLGSHVLDQLLYVFGGEVELREYYDDARGGIEAECEARLCFYHRGQPVAGRVALSSVRNLRNTVRIECERAVLEVPITERYHVSILPRGLGLEDPLRGGPRAYSLQAGWTDESETAWYEAFRAEIDDWLGAIWTGARPQLSGESVLPCVRLIEQCYEQRQPLEEPWIEEGLHRGSSAAVNGESRCPGANTASGAHPAVAKARSPGRVLITGASGFIGCRTAEILCLRDGWQVRALVHNPGSAARLARLPVEMIQGDLRSKADVDRAVADCDAVVHCAIGTAYGQRRQIFAVTVDGTRHLVEAALAAGVRRFVHLSTIAVHGNDVRGIIEESTPVQPERGNEYSESKTEAERIVSRGVARGLPVVILRPGCVYGPHGTTFITRPVTHLAQGRLVLAGSADTPSNTVYVDNVVEAIVRALEAPKEVANGQAFPINEGDDLTWGEFYGYFARAMGVEGPVVLAADAAGQRPGRGFRPLRWLGSWRRGLLEIAKSAELKALA